MNHSLLSGLGRSHPEVGLELGEALRQHSLLRLLLHLNLLLQFLKLLLIKLTFFCSCSGPLCSLLLLKEPLTVFFKNLNRISQALNLITIHQILRASRLYKILLGILGEVKLFTSSESHLLLNLEIKSGLVLEKVAFL